jgi:serine protease inhibitor
MSEMNKIFVINFRNDLGGTLVTGSDRLKVSGILQKAVIEVNEKSTEAAAVSAITISNR